MLIPNNIPIVHYKYSGVNTFDVPFPFYGLSSIRVRIGVSAGNTTPEDLVYGTDFYVVGTPLENFESTQAYAFGTIILMTPGIGKLHTDQGLVVYRFTERSQQFTYNELDSFPAKSHENAIGKLTAQLQEMSEQLARAIKVDITSEDAVISAEDMYLVFQIYVEQALAAVKDVEILVREAQQAAKDASDAAQAIIDAGLSLTAPLTDSLTLEDSTIGASAKAAFLLNQKIEDGGGALLEPRQIAISGGAVGSVMFDGTEDVDIRVDLNVGRATAGILGTVRGGTGNQTGTAQDSNKWQGATKFVSTGQPTGGVSGDIWFQVLGA